MARGDQVQQIKDRLSILDVVSPYVELQKAGKNYKGKSPFTNEKTPSFHVSPDRGMYYCFSSNQGGDIFTFIEKMEGVDFKGALKLLADKAGVELVPEDPKKRDERETEYALTEAAAVFFFKNLSGNKIAEQYVKERGVEGKTIHVWRIGFALDEWRALREHLAEKGYTEVQMQRAGLIKKSDEAKESYDVFRNRIMFPIFDASGRVVAFSGRLLPSDRTDLSEKEVPKYVNSPETPLYQKSDILFGYDKAKQGIRQYDFALIVEGQFDLVLAHQAGYTNTVAVSGTALTSHHIDLLQRLSNRVVLALDADRAGTAAIKRASDMMLMRGMDVKVVSIEGGKDPADIVKEGKELFKKMVGTSVHVIEFLLSVLKDDAKDERAYKLRVREEVIPLLARMPNKIDREHFEGIIAEAINSTKEGVHYEVERVSEERSDEPDEATPTKTEPEQVVRRRENLIEYLYFASHLFVENEHKELGEKTRSTLKELIGNEAYSTLETISASDKSKFLFTLDEQFAKLDDEVVKKDMEEKLTELSQLTAREKLRELSDGLRIAEKEENTAEISRLLEATTQLQAALQKDVSL